MLCLLLHSTGTFKIASTSQLPFAPAGETVTLSSGQRFMTDLLVSSLMGDGGLESALDVAFHREATEVEEQKVTGWYGHQIKPWFQPSLRFV